MHLTNCAFDQTHCAADQFINCAAFDKLCNYWSIAQCTCSRVRVTVAKTAASIGVTLRYEAERYSVID